MTFKEALLLVGGLSKPSKMPCHGYSIPAKECKVGSLLRKIKGTVCEKCYALKGRYVFPNVLAAMYRRFNSLLNPLWVSAMVIVINKLEKSGFFRWHDSGDVQSVQHLKNIAEIARRLPHIKFWLPTRELEILAAYVKTEAIPSNLIIRLSAYTVETIPSKAMLKRLGVLGSAVSAKSWTCPAPKQKNFCLNCRACWDKRVKIVTYKQH